MVLHQNLCRDPSLLDPHPVAMKAPRTVSGDRDALHVKALRLVPASCRAALAVWSLAAGRPRHQGTRSSSRRLQRSASPPITCRWGAERRHVKALLGEPTLRWQVSSTGWHDDRLAHAIEGCTAGCAWGATVWRCAASGAWQWGHLRRHSTAAQAAAAVWTH